VTEEDEEYPHFAGPIVQWPRYGASYRGRFFTIAPVPTDDGRWLIGIDNWTDTENLHATVVAAIDAALATIKDSVDGESTATTANEAGAPVSAPAETDVEAD
jgi:hypothetical protein